MSGVSGDAPVNGLTDMPDELVTCVEHGPASAAFVCGHLLHGRGLGFVEGEPDLYPGDELEAAPCAWCAACEQVRLAAGGWTAASEKAASVTLVCSFCFVRIRERNAGPPAA